jgi:hypothetical protein
MEVCSQSSQAANRITSGCDHGLCKGLSYWFLAKLPCPLVYLALPCKVADKQNNHVSNSTKRAVIFAGISQME